VGQRAGMSPDAPMSAPSVGARVARGDGSALKPCFRAVLVAINRLALLVTHFGVALERAPAMLLPPPVGPERH
jgi:hypothetical protein